MIVTQSPPEMTEEQRNVLHNLLRRFLPNTEIWAFGSRVKHTSRQNSDLDLVVFTSAKNRHIVGNLKDALDESQLPFRVDLHIWDDLPKSFHRNIEQEYWVMEF